MTSYRTAGPSSFSIGVSPPEISWTLVRGDTAAFRVYVEDEDRNPLDITEWDINMDIVREGTTSDTVIVALTPGVTADDDDGEFTVAVTANQSDLLETDDIFDIQLSDNNRTWTIAKGTITVIEDVTGPAES
jgi:hypothetical protein